MSQRNLGLWAVVFAAVMIVPFVPVSSSVSPFDDDAGSGQDAGDTPESALLLTPGAYAGTLANPTDSFDRYAFHAERGQVLEFAWDNLDDGVNIVRFFTPDERPYSHELRDTNPYRSDEEQLMIHATGTWQIVFEVSPISAGPVDYAFSFELLEPDTSAVAAGPDGPAGTVEARFDVPTDVTVHGWVSAPINATDAFAGRWTVTISGFENVDTAEPTPKEGTAGFYMYKSGAGDQVSIMDDPSLDLDITVDDGTDRIEWLNGRTFLDGFVGTIHSVSYRTSSDADTMVGVWADQGEAGGASSDDVIAWTNNDVAATTKVVAPGVSALGPWSQSLELDRSFNGVFSTTGGAVATTDRSGYAEGPDGPGGRGLPWSLILDQPDPGLWTMHVNGTTIGTGSRIFLSGAFTPDVGIWDGVP